MSSYDKQLLESLPSRVETAAEQFSDLGHVRIIDPKRVLRHLFDGDRYAAARAGFPSKTHDLSPYDFT